MLFLAAASDAFIATRASARCRPLTRTTGPVAQLDASWKTLSPCADHQAASLFPQLADGPEEPTHWVAVERIRPAGDALAAALQPGAPDAAVMVGAPAAVARLRQQRGLVDKLLQSIPKEEPDCAVAVGHCVDALLLAWLKHVQEAKEGQVFEDLRAAAQSHTAPVLERRGFAEVENPDMTALGRGEPISTHYARLPSAIIAYDSLLAASDSLSERAVYEQILEALRSQPPPGIAAPRPMP